MQWLCIEKKPGFYEAAFGKEAFECNGGVCSRGALTSPIQTVLADYRPDASKIATLSCDPVGSSTETADVAELGANMGTYGIYEARYS